MAYHKPRGRGHFSSTGACVTGRRGWARQGRGAKQRISCELAVVMVVARPTRAGGTNDLLRRFRVCARGDEGRCSARYCVFGSPRVPKHDSIVSLFLHRRRELRITAFLRPVKRPQGKSGTEALTSGAASQLSMR